MMRGTKHFKHHHICFFCEGRNCHLNGGVFDEKLKWEGR